MKNRSIQKRRKIYTIIIVSFIIVFLVGFLFLLRGKSINKPDDLTIEEEMEQNDQSSQTGNDYSEENGHLEFPGDDLTEYFYSNQDEGMPTDNQEELKEEKTQDNTDGNSSDYGDERGEGSGDIIF